MGSDDIDFEVFPGLCFEVGGFGKTWADIVLQQGFMENVDGEFGSIISDPYSRT